MPVTRFLSRLILFRYWRVAVIKGGGESPTDTLLLDVQLPATAFLWSGINVYLICLQGGEAGLFETVFARCVWCEPL